MSLATNYQLWRLNKEGLLTITKQAEPISRQQAKEELLKHLGPGIEERTAS